MGTDSSKPHSAVIRIKRPELKPSRSWNRSNSSRSRKQSITTTTATISMTTPNSSILMTTPNSSMLKNDSSFNDITDEKYTSSSIPTIIQKEIENGVTGNYLSLSIAETAYIFWQRNIHCLSDKDKLEIGCTIYFTMIANNIETKEILKNNIKNTNQKIEDLSMRFLNMMDFVIRYLLVNNIDLSSTLIQLGIGHKAMGVNMKHFSSMLTAVHQTFAYYFEHKYSIKAKYAIDTLFTVTSQLMMGEDLSKAQMINDFAKSFSNLDFLKNLEVCLQSDVGKRYLYRYLQETFCDELVIWLQSIKKFKAGMSDKERFMIARIICKTSIEPTAAFTINISHQIRDETLKKMMDLNKLFVNRSNQFIVPYTLFEQCEVETIGLIQQNHWKKFVEKIKILRESSCV